MMTDRPKTSFYGWINIALLFVCYGLVFGTFFYGYSVMFPAMVKAMKWARGDAAFGLTTRGLVLGFIAPLIAYMINRWGAKNTMITGGTALMVALVLLGTVVDQLWLWIVVWGGIVGFGVCAAGQVPITTIVTFWFNKNRGLAVSIVLSGASIGGFVVQPLLTWVMQQTGSWQTGWLACTAVLFVGMIGVLWLKNNPADYGQHPDGISPEKVQEAASAGKKLIRTYRTSEEWTTKEASRTSSLWSLTLMYSFCAMSLNLVLAHGVFHLTDLGYTKMQAAYVLSFVALCGGISRIPIGYLADMVEARWISVIMMAGLLLSLVGIWQAPSMTVLIVSGCLFGLCFGAGTVLVPTMVGNYYSPKSFASINGLMFPFQLGLSSVMPVIAGYIHDHFKSYDIAYIAILILACATVLCLFFFAAPPKKTLQAL